MKTASLIIFAVTGLAICGLAAAGEYAGAAFLTCLTAIILGVNRATRPPGH